MRDMVGASTSIPMEMSMKVGGIEGNEMVEGSIEQRKLMKNSWVIGSLESVKGLE